MTEGRDPEKLRRKLIDYAARFPFFKLIGFEVLDLGPGWAHTRLQLRPDLTNPDGIAHGGVIATLIDISITEAMLMTDEFARVRDTRGSMATVDLGVKYLRPLREGALLCKAEIEHRGKRVAHARAVVTDDDDRKLALGTATMMITLGKQAAPRE
jgi:acyl-CoA thioesterase